MAVSIVENILGQCKFDYSNNAGKLTREVIVDGLTGTADAIVYNGFTYLQSHGYPYAGAHPSCTALYLQSISGIDIGNGQAKYTMTYTPFQSKFNPNNTGVCQLSISSYIQSTETNEDKDGDLLSITYNGDTIIATGSFDIGLTNLTFSRTETAPPLSAQSYVGCINSASITWKGYTFGAYTLECVGIPGSPQGDDNSYKVEYQFVYNQFGHDPKTFYYTDPNKNNAIPDDVTAGNGIETFYLKPQVSFSGLNIS